MKRNDEIVQLANEIMVDITDSRLPLHNVLLKSSRLSLLLDMPDNARLFQSWSQYAERNQFILDAYRDNLASAKDPNVSVASANPNQYVTGNHSNILERRNIRKEAQNKSVTLATYRTKTYDFSLGIYNKWQFGNIAENIFEKKRRRVEPVLEELFPDTAQRLNSIEQNLRSTNSEDWKNAVGSCRALLMDLADILNPPKTADDKGKYINRLKDYISPKIESATGKKLYKAYFDEIKARIEYTIGLTQGGAHQGRPVLTEAEDVVLYTYLLVAELIELYDGKNKNVRLDKLVDALKNNKEPSRSDGSS